MNQRKHPLQSGCSRNRFLSLWTPPLPLADRRGIFITCYPYLCRQVVRLRKSRPKTIGLKSHMYSSAPPPFFRIEAGRLPPCHGYFPFLEYHNLTLLANHHFILCKPSYTALRAAEFLYKISILYKKSIRETCYHIL